MAKFSKFWTKLRRLASWRLACRRKKNGILQLAVPLEASDVNTICTQYPEETEQARLRGYIYTETHTTTDGVTELSLDRAGKAAEGTRYGN